MEIKRIDVFSCARVAAILYALLGLIFGGLFSLFAVAGVALQTGESEDAALGMLFGAGAIVIMPIMYGVLGGISVAIGAALYNLVAGMVGGIEVELTSKG